MALFLFLIPTLTLHVRPTYVTYITDPLTSSAVNGNYVVIPMEIGAILIPIWVVFQPH